MYIHLIGVCVGFICLWPVVIESVSSCLYIYACVCTIMLGFHSRCWGCYFSRCYCFPGHSFVCAFSHNLCVLTLLEFLSWCYKNSGLLKYGVVEYTHQLSVLLFCAGVSVSVYTSFSPLIKETFALHLDAASLCSSAPSLPRRRMKQAGHPGIRTHLLTDVQTKRAVMCSVSLWWNVTGLLLFDLCIFTYRCFQTTGMQFSPSQSRARPMPNGLLNKQDVWILFFCKWRP